MSQLTNIEYKERTPTFLREIKKDLNISETKSANPLSLTEMFHFINKRKAVEKEVKERPFYDHEKPVITNLSDFSETDVKKFNSETNGQFLTETQIRNLKSTKISNKNHAQNIKNLKFSCSEHKNKLMAQQESHKKISKKDVKKLKIKEKLAKMSKILK
ncbi:hypothetical protein MHBO_003782 [Bonamia ostreae]|uniref:Uncharacterized protein n=1 Tax=Bonamia ostreae TaxID=126728 RepID=A0ABV2AS09_9EUKA